MLFPAIPLIFLFQVRPLTRLQSQELTIRHSVYRSRDRLTRLPRERIIRIRTFVPITWRMVTHDRIDRLRSQQVPH